MARANCPASIKLNELALIVKMGNVGTVEKDIEALAAFMVKALNNGGEEDIATLARLAKALKS